MADLINPRLFDRVERSLRKRTNSLVEPHLLRCAAHAKSEDEFMAAASRLLLNLQERQQWLGSWATRRQHESEDTTPAELGIDVDIDISQPGALDEAPLQRSFFITPAQRDRLRYALSKQIGPAAAALIESESQHADSVVELLERLESHLESADQRAQFRETTSSSSKSRPGV